MFFSGQIKPPKEYMEVYNKVRKQIFAGYLVSK